MKLYRVDFEGGSRHVEAASFGRALFRWREWVVKEFGPDSGWNPSSDPDSITLIDEEPVIR